MRTREDDILCKYLNIYEFLDLIIGKRLFFTKPKNYSDINDSKISKKGISELANNINYMLKFRDILEIAPENFLPQENTLSIIENFYKNTTYTACFSILDEYDTKYMWQNYASNGVMIKTTSYKLKNSIKYLSEKKTEKSLLVLMDHIKYEDNVDNKDYCIFSKQKKFSKEGEYRIAITNCSFANNQCSPKGEIYYINQIPINENDMYVSINPNTLIEKIIISPYLKDWQKNILKNLINGYGYNFLLENSSLNI